MSIVTARPTGDFLGFLGFYGRAVPTRTATGAGARKPLLDLGQGVLHLLGVSIGSAAHVVQPR